MMIAKRLLMRRLCLIVEDLQKGKETMRLLFWPAQVAISAEYYLETFLDGRSAEQDGLVACRVRRG